MKMKIKKMKKNFFSFENENEKMKKNFLFKSANLFFIDTIIQHIIRNLYILSDINKWKYLIKKAFN